MAGSKLWSSPISVAQQFWDLKRMYTEMEIRMKRNSLVCSFKVKPSPLSKLYQVKLFYSLHKRPKVILYGQNVKGLEKTDFPHIHSKDLKKGCAELCLFRWSDEWNNHMYISRTIIPWIVEWLFHYEIWLVTGQWNGGGIHNGMWQEQ